MVALYEMSLKYEIGWLQLLIKEQLNQTVDVKKVSSLLRCLGIFEAIGLNANNLYHHVSQIPFKKLMESEEYQFLKASVKFKLIIERVNQSAVQLSLGQLKDFSDTEVRNIQRLLMELLFPDEKNKLPIDEDMHNAHAPSAQML